MSMEIMLATEKEEGLVLSILNAATQKLLWKNIKQWEYPWDAQLIRNDIKQGHQYIAWKQDNAVAVFSLAPLHNNPWAEAKDEDMYFYRFAVAPHAQGTGVGAAICKCLFACLDDSHQILYLDCWAGNDTLRCFYTHAGFEYLGDFPEDNYQISVFRWFHEVA